MPHAFVATKVITHPLVGPRAHAPAGWAHGFSEPGAGCRPDRALRSSRATMRLMPAQRSARAGTRYASSPPVPPAAAVSSWSRTATGWMPPSGRSTLPSWRAMRLVLEENLVDVTTHSVGQVRVAELVASYHGTQRLTPDNHGEQVYGGSDLLRRARRVSRRCSGSISPPEARLAVAQAQTYDAAAEAEFPGLLRVAPQLRRRPGQRRPGPPALRRARAVLAHRRRQRGRDRGARGVPGRPGAAVRPSLDGRALWRGPHAAATGDRSISRAPTPRSGRSPNMPW